MSKFTEIWNFVVNVHSIEGDFVEELVLVQFKTNIIRVKFDVCATRTMILNNFDHKLV